MCSRVRGYDGVELVGLGLVACKMVSGFRRVMVV